MRAQMEKVYLPKEFGLPTAHLGQGLITKEEYGGFLKDLVAEMRVSEEEGDTPEFKAELVANLAAAHRSVGHEVNAEMIEAARARYGFARVG